MITPQNTLHENKPIARWQVVKRVALVVMVLALNAALAQSGQLEIQVEPASALVRVVGPDGYNQALQGGETLSDLRPGRYFVTASGPGYRPVFDEVRVEEGETATVSLSLEPVQLQLEGQTLQPVQPITQPVTVPEETEPAEPPTVQPAPDPSLLQPVQPIERQVTAEPELPLEAEAGAQDEEAAQVLDQAQQTLERIRQEQGRRGEMLQQVQQALAAARQALEQAERALQEARASLQPERQTEVQEGLQEQMQEVQEEVLAPLATDETLEVSETGSLEIRVEPAGATVLIIGPDGYEQQAQDGDTLSGLQPGRYFITATAAGYSVATEEVTLEAGESVSLELSLAAIDD